MKFDLLGTKIDNISKQEILDKISCFLHSDKFRYIITINPEIILKAQNDAKLKNIINNSNLSMPTELG